MLKDTFIAVQGVQDCNAKQQRVPMESLQVMHPLELVHLDFLMIKKFEGGTYVHILVITDHFTICAQALVTTSQTTMCTMQNLCKKFIVHYGLPGSILTDQSRNYKSNLITELCKISQIEKLSSSLTNKWSV